MNTNLHLQSKPCAFVEVTTGNPQVIQDSEQMPIRTFKSPGTICPVPRLVSSELTKSVPSYFLTSRSAELKSLES